MIEYSQKNLKHAEKYMESLGEGTAARTFSEIPYALAVATVHIIATGGQKLTRDQVKTICKVDA